MNDKFIPEIIKVKTLNLARITYSFILFLFSLFVFLSLYSYNIDDNSFLASTSNPSHNIFGDIGSYFASFVFYTFGALSYLICFFFVSLSINTIRKREGRYFFLRLFVFLISLILLPQSIMLSGFELNFFDELKSWGEPAVNLFSLYSSKYFSYGLSFMGLFLFIISTDFYKFFNLKFKKFFILPKINLSVKKKAATVKKTKKDPLINTFPIKENDQEKSNISNIKKNQNIFYSPSLEILESENLHRNKIETRTLKEQSNLLETVFADFNIEIKVINIKQGPVVTLYEILPSPGIKISTIINLAHDISRSMGVGAVRISQILGTQYLGVEVPNTKRETITIKELLINDNFRNSDLKIPICIGKDISGNIEVVDLSKTPHLLVAGTTGSGKSVFINTLLASLLYKFSPKELRLILIDPKMLELSVYNDIAHLLTPVVTEPKKSIIALKWVCKEMERRYSLMNEEGCRNLDSFNQKSSEKLPFIIVFIDEMADLMMTAGKEVEHYVQRLAQMARACGIHLVMATQRPSVDIITGSIKANFPSRISFQVASKYDSRTILGEVGAEQLLGNGDMLMMKNGGNIVRYQSAFISDNEVNKLIKEIKSSQQVEYLDEIDEIINNDGETFDDLSDEDEALISKSIDLIKNSNKASTSYLQRNFQIGYNKAARIMETLEKRGVVSEPNHSGKRQILI